MVKTVRVLIVTFALVLVASSAYAQKAAIGTWAFTGISPEGESKMTLVISEDAGKLKAVAKSERGERPFDSIAVEGSKITLVLTISYNGSPMTITFNGKIDGPKMEGETDFGGLATGTWSATAQK
jgi:hypothetical protein